MTQLQYRGAKHNLTTVHKSQDTSERLYRGVKYNPIERQTQTPLTSGVYRGAPWSVQAKKKGRNAPFLHLCMVNWVDPLSY